MSVHLAKHTARATLCTTIAVAVASVVAFLVALGGAGVLSIGGVSWACVLGSGNQL